MATITRTIDTQSATPIDSDSYTSVAFTETAAAGVNTFAIQQATETASIGLRGAGDTVMIEGLSSEYTVKRAGKTVLLKNVTTGQAIALSFGDMSAATPVKSTLVFLDGELELGNNQGSRKIFLGDQRVTKIVKSVVASVDTSNTDAADYFDDLTGAGGENAIARTYYLTPENNTIAAGFNNDVIEGVFGDASNANNTFNLGDNIDGGDGNDTLNLIATGTTPSAVSIIVKGVETINVSDSVGSTVTATQFSDNPTINFNNTAAGNTSTVTAASLGSVVGLAGEGNLTVDYASTAGAADMAKVSVNGAGSEANRSTINVADGNTIEKVQIATAGANYIDLMAGANAEEVHVTGNGTNDVDISAAGAVADDVMVDASASTGSLALRMGDTLNSGDTIKGGSSDSDTVYADFNDGGTSTPTMSGIETLEASYGSVVTHNLTNVTGLQTINMAGVDGNVTVVNADSSLKTINIEFEEGTTVDEDIRVSYDSGEEGDLEISIGTSGGIGDIDVTRAKSLTISTTNGGGNSGGTVTSNDYLDSYTINVAASGALDLAGSILEGGVGAININVGEQADYSGWIGTGGAGTGDIGDVTMVVGQEGDAELWIGQSGGFGVGNVTIHSDGADASAAAWIYVDDGASIGDISVHAEGISAYAEVYATASGGNIGDITLIANGQGAEIIGFFSAGDYEGQGSGSSPTVTVGNVHAEAIGRYSEVSAAIYVSGGDIGNITLIVNGTGAEGSIRAQVTGETRDTDGDGVYEYMGGGNIGNVVVDVNGIDASGDVWLTTSGGNIGDITLTANGHSADLNFNISANQASGNYQLSPVSIGDVTVNIQNGATVSGSITADGGDIGNITIDAMGHNVSGSIEIEAKYASGRVGVGSGYIGGGNIGDVNVTYDATGASEFELVVIASGGDVGDVSWTQTGEGTSGSLDVRAWYISGGVGGGHGGHIGNVDIDVGFDTQLDAWIQADSSIGDITLTAGATASTSLDISGGNADAALGPREIGDITINTGDQSNLDLNISGGFEILGDVSVYGGKGSDLELTFNLKSGDISSIYLAGGDKFASAYIGVSAASVGIVDASLWGGELQVVTTGVDAGTEIRTGTWESYVYTNHDTGDTIRLGTGSDYVELHSNTVADRIYGFNYTKDELDIVNATDLKALLSSDTAVTLITGDVQRLVDITGGDNITTEAGLIAALEGGEYDSVDITANATVTLITAASSSATTFYIWEVNDADGGADFEASEVTLVGTVTGNATLANLDIAGANISLV